MKLIRFGETGKEKPGVMINDESYDVSGFIKDYDEDFFEMADYNISDGCIERT